MQKPEPVDIDAAFEEGTLIDEAMDAAVAQVIREHQRDNMPLACWRDGKVEWVSPFDPTIAGTNGNAHHD